MGRSPRGENRLKLLVLTNLYPPHYVGGYELRCRQITEALRRRGHEARVLTSNHGIKEFDQPPAEPGVERRLRVHGFFGHPWLPIGRLRELEFFNNRAVVDAVRKTAPDVVHVWNLGGISKSLVFTLARLGAPTLYDVSDHWIARSLKADVWLDWWNRSNPGAGGRVMRAAWTLLGRRRAWDAVAPTNPVRQARFPHIYFCSAALRRLTAAAGYPVEHGAVIHCPVDLQRFHGDSTRAAGPLRRLLYVGRFAEDKGVHTALKAFRRVPREFGVELTLCGKGDETYTDGLRRFVSENNLAARFTSATAAEMPAVYRSHDALLFTSEWEEPFALTPLEAMACGLPVIGTTTGGSKELLRHADNALTYRAGDDEELAGNIMALVGDSPLRTRLAAAGQADVARFAEPVIVDQIEAMLKQTLAAGKPSAPPAYFES